MQLNGLGRDKALKIFFILEDDFSRVKGEISGITHQEPLDVKGRGKNLVSVLFDGFEVMFLDLGRIRDFLQGDAPCLPFSF